MPGEDGVEHGAGGGQLAGCPGFRGGEMQPLALRGVPGQGGGGVQARQRLGAEARLQGEQEDVGAQQMAQHQRGIGRDGRIEPADRIAAIAQHVGQRRLEALEASRLRRRSWARHVDRASASFDSGLLVAMERLQTVQPRPIHEAVTRP